MSIEEWNDDMHRLIVDRLKERNRKMEIIRSYETPKKGRAISFVGVLVAACMVGIIFHLTINQPQDSTAVPIRSSMSNVQELIDDGKYDEAFTIVQKELQSAYSTLNQLNKEGTNNDEETQYEIEVLKLKIQDLSKERDALRKKMK